MMQSASTSSHSTKSSIFCAGSSFEGKGKKSRRNVFACARTKKTRRQSAVHIEAIQTPKKPSSSSSSSSVESSSVPMHKRGEEDDVKEAYPFEKEYKDCAF
jgi:hypothetical protein